MTTKLFGSGSVLFLLTVNPLASIAEDNTFMDEIVTYGQRYLQPESQVSTIVDEHKALPGASNFLDLERDIIGSERTLDTVLSFEPGVIMQPFFGSNDQARINIRGSGIQDNPVNRGVMLLFEGMPLNQADGSFIIGLVDPSQARFVTIFRGANGTSWGGTTLGGALNMTARTGHNSRNSLRLAGGSNNTLDGRVKLGFVDGDWDFSLVGGYAASDGHRTHNSSERLNITANAGYSFSQDAETRFYVTYTDNFFDIPFVAQKDIALNRRDAVLGDGVAGHHAPPAGLPAPAVALWNSLGGWDGVFNVNTRRPSRDTRQLRVANKTRYSNGGSRHEIGLALEDVDDTFKDPLSHSVVDATTWSASYRFDHGGSVLSAHDRIQLSVVAYGGKMPRRLYVNEAATGARGFQFADLDLDASNISIGGQWTMNVSDGLGLYVGAQYFHSSRTIKGTGSTPPPPPDAARVALDRVFKYDAFNPKIGVIYQPNDDLRLYANVSRSAETPTFNHLLPTTVGAFAGLDCAAPLCREALFSGVRIQDIDKQTATTYELGASGDTDGLSWEATYFYSDVDDELITLVEGFAVNAETTNYTDKTIHQGIEFAANGQLAGDIFRAGDRLVARMVYNYSAFKFKGGVFDQKRIAGVPEHLIRAELAWKMGDAVSVAPNLTWQPTRTPADHLNIQHQDSFFLLGLKAEYIHNEDWKVFADLQNILNEKYVTSYVIRGISAANQPTFLSGPGFRVFLGIEKTF